MFFRCFHCSSFSGFISFRASPQSSKNALICSFCSSICWFRTIAPTALLIFSEASTSFGFPFSCKVPMIWKISPPTFLICSRVGVNPYYFVFRWHFSLYYIFQSIIGIGTVFLCCLADGIRELNQGVLGVFGFG